ncbi:MAG TPA: GGDEF domain-containing protein [Terracidiphilus sp.]|nr:GGDEF domain-containing protein [Terracidiphilus sp.]
MAKLTPALTPTEPDNALLDRLARLERIALWSAISLFILDLVAWFFLLLDWSVPGRQHLVSAETACVALLCSFSLLFSGSHSLRKIDRLAVPFAAAAVVLCAAVICEYVFHISLGIDVFGAAGGSLASEFAARMSLQSAFGYGLLGICLTMIRARKRPALLIADLLIYCLLLVVLIQVSTHIIAHLGIMGPPEQAHTRAAAMLGLLLLSAVALLRKAEHGLFSILLGHGIGSNIARGLSPLLLLLPYLRECARARFFSSARMPPDSTTAVLASVAFMVSFALLLFLAWRINYMEVEIRDLSLRDALTDLYNLRGFRLLAEQALRMARRSNMPFSVLYIDLDNLKRTNDTLGHQAGSDLLVEMGKILKYSFREIDIVARIGGDEFAVAGQFSQSGIGLAAQRVQEGVERRNAEDGHPTALSFSSGHCTTESAQQGLDELLAKADAAMYTEKNRKKLIAS